MPLFEVLPKVVVLDWGLFMHRSVYAWWGSVLRKEEYQCPPEYIALRSMITCLSHIGLDLNDQVIVAQDGRGNWRKVHEKTYKSNRPELRKASGIDWSSQYEKFDGFIETLKIATPFHFVKIDLLEADDIIASACRYYDTRQTIAVSTDSDFQQLYAHSNFKLFSPHSKRYTIVDNPYNVLQKKIKREVTDNLVSELITQADYDRRKLVVDLINLPDEIYQKAKVEFDKLEDTKEYDLELLPFRSLRSKFMSIYSKGKISYEKCLKAHLRKKQKRRVKK